MSRPAWLSSPRVLRTEVLASLSAAHIWDASSVAALDAITTKYESRGKHAEIVGLNDASTKFHENLSGTLGR